jgi:GNAT superfamily N-acetyltransferase
MSRHSSDTKAVAQQDTFQGQSLGQVLPGQGGAGHIIGTAESREALQAYADVWTAVHPDAPLSGDEVRRRAAELDDGRRYFLAELAGEAVGNAFASRTSVGGRAATLVAVLPAYRRRGIGSALLDASLAHARGLGASTAAGTLGEESLPWAERRGFQVFDREVELILELAGDEAPGEPPRGIRIAELSEPYLEGAYRVFAEGVGDIPADGALTTTPISAGTPTRPRRRSRSLRSSKRSWATPSSSDALQTCSATSWRPSQARTAVAGLGRP